MMLEDVSIAFRVVMKILFAIYAASLGFVLAVILADCGGVVRDSYTYKQELAVLGALTSRLADQQLIEAATAASMGAQDRCVRLAENALVAYFRAPYHIGTALYLAGLGDRPEAVPLVPTSTAWCAERAKR